MKTAFEVLGSSTFHVSCFKLKEQSALEERTVSTLRNLHLRHLAG